MSFPALAGSTPAFLLIGPLGWSELLIILILVLIFFGPRKLPEVAEAIGKSIRKFRKASSDVKKELEESQADLSEGDDKEG
jgi:sec-independent protein translocase protein TatA